MNKYRGDKCLKGCGKSVITRSGICPQCRTKKCIYCDKQFTWKDLERQSCISCRQKAKSENVKYREVLGHL